MVKFDGKGTVEDDLRPFRATACERHRKAQSLIATPCKKCVFRASVPCHRKCCFTESSAEWASSTRGAACVEAFVIFLWFETESLYMSVSRELRAGCSQVNVAQCQIQTGLTEF